MDEKEAGHNVFILGNVCYRCKHKWVQRNKNEKPAVCPKCKSPYWDKPKSKSTRLKNGKTK